MIQFGLKQKDIDKINQVFASYEGIDSVVIYGSRAKGNFKAGSDIDLTIIENSLTFPEFLEIENALDDLLLPYKIDLSLKRKISNVDLLSHINKIGKLFYKSENSLG
ncbi:nucleotidyltransferase domain-containing protein [Flavobacterium sp. GSP27]|uniref:nucleotidyltransferase domain-containing protein n=1 Tax=unclassified Flavobacterium TaxID=196869 RepID=UPI000F832A39|nr:MULTISPECIES: nucleotidyltransferase domain-containing protein [unclassified Flavobacterium]RTZ06742.1 nucleotidyltransferase domain-containing protein [Flavobacterium sp. GSP6]RTZ07214.1 nucleotidyltransferase domain-containing protein [Flavobacterium sp. GSP27]